MTKPLVLVIGAGGFTGRHFLEYARLEGLGRRYGFVALDSVFGFKPFCRTVTMDALDAAAFSALLVRIRPDYIVNFASVFSAENLSLMHKVNAGITLAVLEYCRTAKVRRALFIGSAAEYGIPEALPVKESAALAPCSQYGLSKAVQAGYIGFYARMFGVDAILARTFNISGAGLSERLALGSFAQQINRVSRSGVICTGNLDARRDYLDVRDVVDAYWKLLLRGRRGETYNVCSGKSCSMKSLLEAMIAASGKSIKISVKKDRLRKADIGDIYGSNARLKRDTGWRQEIDVLESVADMVENENRDN